MHTKFVALAVAVVLGACTPASEGGGSSGGSESGGSSGGAGSGGSKGNAGTGGVSAPTGSNSGGAGGGDAPGTGGTSNTGTSNTGGSGTGGTSNAGGGGSGGGSGSGGTTGNAGSGGSGAQGSPDGSAGAADAPGSAASGCMGVTAAFCDDFEGQTVGGAPKGDAFTTQGNAFAVETTKAFSGTKAVHIHVAKGSGGPNTKMVFKKQFPLANNDLHGRVMVFLTQNPADATNAGFHWDMIFASGGGKTYVLGSMYNGAAKAGAFMPVYHPGDRSIDTKTPFPIGKWSCIQWQFRYGGAGDLLQIKQDGKIVDLGKSTAEGAAIVDGRIAAWPAGPWSQMSFGYDHYQSLKIDVDLWFDDLAFGAQEIPCPAAPGM
jgi:hypothetical protein